MVKSGRVMVMLSVVARSMLRVKANDKEVGADVTGLEIVRTLLTTR